MAKRRAARRFEQGVDALSDAVIALQSGDPARAARLGETITARTGGTETTGVFEGIDETGALILSTPRGRKAIPAADIYFGGA